MYEITLRMPRDLWERAERARGPFTMQDWLLRIISDECVIEERLVLLRKAAPVPKCGVGSESWRLNDIEETERGGAENDDDNGE